MIRIQRKFGFFGTLCKCNIITKADTQFLLKLLFLNFCVTLKFLVCAYKNQLTIWQFINYR